MPDYSQWDFETTLAGSTVDAVCVAFAPDGKSLAIGGGNAMKVVEVPSGEVSARSLSSARFAPLRFIRMAPRGGVR